MIIMTMMMVMTMYDKKNDASNNCGGDSGEDYDDDNCGRDSGEDDDYCVNVAIQ